MKVLLALITLITLSSCSLTPAQRAALAQGYSNQYQQDQYMNYLRQDSMMKPYQVNRLPAQVSPYQVNRLPTPYQKQQIKKSNKRIQMYGY